MPANPTQGEKRTAPGSCHDIKKIDKDNRNFHQANLSLRNELPSL